MTEHIKINGITPRIRYTGNGVNKAFEFPFAIFESANLKVYIGDTLQDISTYTLSGEAPLESGSITFNSAPANGAIVTLQRSLNIKRSSDFQEGSSLRAKVLNDELDYQTACLQEVADNLNRSMVLPPYAADAGVNLTLPTPAAGKSIVWNSDGTNLENSNVEVNSLESTLLGYKTAAETASATATTKATEAATSATTASAQATLATTTVANKANKDMDNLTADGKGKISELSSISASYINITEPANNADVYYTAPADGFVYYSRRKTSGAGALAYIVNQTNGSELNNSPFVESVPASIMMPVKAGDICILGRQNLTGAFMGCRFYYKQGEI